MKHEMMIRKGNIDLAKEIENLYKYTFSGEEIQSSCGNLGEAGDGILLRKFHRSGSQMAEGQVIKGRPYTGIPGKS